MKKLNVLHIASFSGNIGDNANHKGFRQRLKDTLQREIKFHEIEMREFYRSWNLKSFNSDEFIETCNQYDLVVIGGGNFFELKWDYSCTGTTIDINLETLNKINPPILFNALGCDIAKGTNEENISKFGKFLDYLTASDKYIVSVRNDGSYSTLNNLYDQKYSDKILRVPDAGFFMKNIPDSRALTGKGYKTIGINIVTDMKEVRFDKNKKNGLSYEQFIEGFANELNILMDREENYRLILFPHIHSDLIAICDLLEKMNDIYVRTRIIIAPCLIGEGAEDSIFSLYKQCEFILGMRFHSNVCAISQNIPTIALSSYKKINDLYAEIDLLERVVNVNQIGFERILNDKIQSTIGDLDTIKERYKQVNEKIHSESEVFYTAIKKWCEKNGVI